MNMLRTALLIARRDYRERIRGRTFLVATALLVVLSVGGVIAADKGKGWFGAGTETHTIGVVNPPSDLPQALQRAGNAFDMHINTRDYPGADAANAALGDGQVDAVLVGTDQLRFKDAADTKLSSAVSQAVAALKVTQQLRAAGLAPAVIGQVLSPQPLEVISNVERGAKNDNVGAAFITAIVLFGALMTYNQWILGGVVEEKATRIVEVLLAVVRPWELLTGKLLGVLGVALTQMAIVAVAFVLALGAVGGVSIPQVSADNLVAAVVWFVLGLGFYSVAFAAVGATVSRQEDAATAAAPLTMMLMAAYFISLFLVTSSPGGLAAQVLTFVPPAAPMIVPVRYSLGAISPTGFVASIVVMAVATAVVSWLGGRLYTGAVLQTGPRLGLGDALRTIRRRRVETT
ncbi:MAG TPA: ABC transporter permease [Tepidiformaceae bacterium]|nr:ABC transporter permease [Tepidiformaceae bacterium]